MTYIFPPERCPALAAVDIADGVLAGRHLPIIWFTLDHVHTVRVAW